MDECLPKKLKRLLPGHAIRTVPELGFASLKNGALLKALCGKFKAFITIDSNLSFQQNLPALPFASILLSAPSNRLKDLALLAPAILETLEVAKPGSIHHISLRG